MFCFESLTRPTALAAGEHRGIAVWLPALVVAVTLATNARADWNPGDPYKMHFPQLPNPNGWDILFVGPANEVADDWQCTESGPVTDLHFWYSIQGDGTSTISSVTANIYSDNPSPPAPFSTPATLLWSGTFASQQFVTRLSGSGNQGFANPKLGTGGWTPADHVNYYQLNITGIENPFVQTQGMIYWLGLNVAISGTSPIGWKTAINQFQDDAVYLVSSPPSLGHRTPFEFARRVDGHAHLPALSGERLGWIRDGGRLKRATLVIKIGSSRGGRSPEQLRHSFLAVNRFSLYSQGDVPAEA